jgi:hypothetical protein
MVAKKAHPYNPSIWWPFKILMARQQEKENTNAFFVNIIKPSYNTKW